MNCKRGMSILMLTSTSSITTKLMHFCITCLQILGMGLQEQTEMMWDILCHSGCPCPNNTNNPERSKWCWFSLIVLMGSSVHHKVSWGQTMNADYYQTFLENYLNLAMQESSESHHRCPTNCGTWKSMLSCAKTYYITFGQDNNGKFLNKLP